MRTRALSNKLRRLEAGLQRSAVDDRALRGSDYVEAYLEEYARLEEAARRRAAGEEPIEPEPRAPSAPTSAVPFVD